VYDHEHTHFFRPPAESYSPYAELLRVIDLVPRAGTLLDLGSGMGRAAMAALLVRRDVHYIGYEVVLERVRVANDALARMGAGGRVRVFCRRLGHRGRLKLPSLEDNSVVIFMFNPFAPATLRHMLAQLRVWATKHRFIIVFKAMAEELAAEHRVWRALRALLRSLSSRETGLPRCEFLVYRTIPQRRLLGSRTRAHLAA